MIAWNYFLIMYLNRKCNKFAVKFTMFEGQRRRLISVWSFFSFICLKLNNFCSRWSYCYWSNAKKHIEEGLFCVHPFSLRPCLQNSHIVTNSPGARTVTVAFFNSDGPPCFLFYVFSLAELEFRGWITIRTSNNLFMYL